METQLTAEQTQELEILKGRISGPHNKIPFAERFRDVVLASSRISGSSRFLGMMKSSSGGLWIRSQTLGEFLNLRPNSINKNLRDFGFRRITGTKTIAEIRKILPNLGLDVRTWSLWKNFVSTFNEFTTDAQLEKLTAYGCIARHTNSLLEFPSLSQLRPLSLPLSPLSPPTPPTTPSTLPSTLPSVSPTQWSPSEPTELFSDQWRDFNDDFGIAF
jgi:hypothetical protein